MTSQKTQKMAMSFWALQNNRYMPSQQAPNVPHKLQRVSDVANRRGNPFFDKVKAVATVERWLYHIAHHGFVGCPAKSRGQFSGVLVWGVGKFAIINAILNST